MNRPSSSKPLASAVLGLAALAAAGAAQARTEVHFSIGAQPSYVYVQPPPVYVQPRPVYVQPQPVYVQPYPIHVQPRPIHGPGYGHHRGPRRGPWGDHDRDGVPNLHDPDHPRHWRHADRWHRGYHH